MFGYLKPKQRAFTPLETMGRHKRDMVSLTGFTPLETMGRHKRDMVSLTGFTLIELLLVISIILILAGISIPNFVKSREQAMDREAEANLRLIIAAERSRRMETGLYYASTGGCAGGGHECNINAQLRLLLPEANRNWNYLTTVQTAPDPDTCCAQATRNVAGGGSWRMLNTEPDPVPAATCPASN